MTEKCPPPERLPVKFVPGEFTYDPAVVFAEAPNPKLTEEVLQNQLKRESTPLFGGFNARLDARMEAQKKANQEAYAERMAEERGDAD